METYTSKDIKIKYLPRTPLSEDKVLSSIDKIKSMDNCSIVVSVCHKRHGKHAFGQYLDNVYTYVLSSGKQRDEFFAKMMELSMTKTIVKIHKAKNWRWLEVFLVDSPDCQTNISWDVLYNIYDRVMVLKEKRLCSTVLEWAAVKKAGMELPRDSMGA